MADVSQVKLPNGTTYNIKDTTARSTFAQYRRLDDPNYDTINVTELNSGNIINTGAARFLNTINGSISGNAATATSASQLSGLIAKSSQTWGNQTGTFVHGEDDSTGGSIAFRRDNPSNGQMSMIIDGTIYIKEGGQNVSEAVKSFSVNGTTVTYTTLWGNTGTFTTQDTNDQFSLGINGNSVILKKNGTTQDTITVPYTTSAGTASNLTNFENNNSTAKNANDVTYNAHTYYTSNGPSTTLGASANDGALYTQAYSTAWVGQIAQDYRNGNLFTRGKNNGTWQEWRKVAYIGDEPTAHNQSADTITYGYLNTQPENKPVIIPFIHNDLAFMTDRGGSTIVKYDGITQSIDISGCFDAAPGYGYKITNSDDYTSIVMELTLHQTFTFTSTIYVDFGASGWRAKDVEIEVMNYKYPGDTWTSKYHNTSNTLGHCYVTTTYIPSGASSIGAGFNKIRFTFKSFNKTQFRIAQLGVYNYTSDGVRTTYMSRGIDDAVWRSITPATDNTYNLGSSSLKWANVYATTFHGNLNGVATTARKIINDTIRPTTADGIFSDAGLRYYLASSSMSTHKPPLGDGRIIHMPWDTTAGWASQLYLTHNNGNTTNGTRVMVRSQYQTTWNDWTPVAVFNQTTPTTGQVVVTDGTDGGIKSSGYTIAKSVPSDAVFTDSNVSQSATTTSNWRKIVLSYQDAASAGTAVTANTNVVYVTPNAEIQPSTGTIRSAGNMIATIFGVTASNGTSGGISLYSGAGNVDNYGIAFRKTADKGKHGYVQSDWATYFTMNSGATTRGWVFKLNQTNGNVASISGAGNAVFNGSLTIGGNEANTSGCRLVYSSLGSVDFVFV